MLPRVLPRVRPRVLPVCCLVFVHLTWRTQMGERRAQQAVRG